MTNDTKPITQQDLRLLLDLAEGKVPATTQTHGSPITLGNNTPVFLEEIIIDVDAYRKHCEKQEQKFYFRPTMSKKEARATGWSGNREEIELYCEQDRTGKEKLGVYSNGFLYTLTHQDILYAAQKLSVPATLKNKATAIFSNIFSKEMAINGITCKTESGKYLLYKSKLIPKTIALTEITPEAENLWRKANVDFRVNALQQSAEHMKKIPTKTNHKDLPTLLSLINHEIPEYYGHTNTYADCGERFVDAEGKINLGLSHFIASSCDLHHEDIEHQGKPVGYVKIRPILSTGEVATPEVIDRYIKDYNKA